VLSTCTSEGSDLGLDRGFSILELLIGLSLALALAAAVVPVWISLGSLGVRQGDKTVSLLQTRVAIARFERDLRLASGRGCPFSASGAVLEAKAAHVIFLQRPSVGFVPTLVEWEIVDGSLMRRSGPCPAARPASYPHSLYADNKTMLEGVQGGSLFRYLVRGVEVAAPIVEANLAAVEGVILDLRVQSNGVRSPLRAESTGRVGR